VAPSDSSLLILLALIALVGPIVTAAATLTAVQLSSRSDRLREQERHRQERARWHLELRTSAYSTLIETADHFRTAAHAVYLTPPNDPEYHGYLGEVDRVGQELDDAGSRISLLGSPQVQPVLDQLLAHTLGAVHVAAISASAPAEPQQWEKANERFLDLYDQFIKAARKDLGTEEGAS
jgi:hypothetical protein